MSQQESRDRDRRKGSAANSSPAFLVPMASSPTLSDFLSCGFWCGRLLPPAGVSAPPPRLLNHLSCSPLTSITMLSLASSVSRRLVGTVAAAGAQRTGTRAAGSVTSLRQKGHRALPCSHVSMQSMWKAWEALGSCLRRSSSANSARQTAHSSADDAEIPARGGT